MDKSSTTSQKLRTATKWISLSLIRIGGDKLYWDKACVYAPADKTDKKSKETERESSFPATIVYI